MSAHTSPWGPHVGVGRKRKEGEERERPGAGGRWAGLGPARWLARAGWPLFFFDKTFPFFLFSVLKTGNKTIAKLFIKICKNTFQRAYQI